ncbi:MAG: adenylate/guanylate cyclase domain-containing protein [Acidimicrobiia bacterium]
MTFLITDIEGSTEMLQSLGDAAFSETLERHSQILRQAFGKEGTVVHVTGDSFFAVFTDALAAIVAASEVQKRLATENWGEARQVRVRLGVHSGEGRLGGDDYVGLDVHRAARISSAARGGQVLLSEETARRVAGRLPPEFGLREMGRHRLKDLSHPEELYQLIIEGLPNEFAPISSVVDRAGNLPSVETSFVGRQDQIDQVIDMITSRRLVTLTGPGGTGKTRLSIEVGARLSDDLPFGTFFVDLAEVTSEDMIPRAILTSLDFPTISGDPRTELIAHLSDKELLLILDNYEQILPEASLVAELLTSAPGLKIVITSRAPLHLTLEHEYSVPPMRFPEKELETFAEIGSYESVELFVQRATSVNPSFRFDASNAEEIGQLIRRLDGLPLAIELAASRVRLFTPAEILDRLSNRILANPAPDVPARQQTITNAIAWSYELLDPTVQTFLEQFSVFRGGAGLNEVELVCNPGNDLRTEALDALSQLVDHSLIEAKSMRDSTRYQMLVVVREFAEGRLADGDNEKPTRDRHLGVYANLAARAEPLLLTSHQGKWLDILTLEHDNLRTAHDWAIASGAVDAAHELVGNLWRFWQRRGHLTEAESRIEQTLAMAGSTPIPRARALDACGGVRYWRGDWDAAKDPYLASLQLMREYGEPLDIAYALYNASFPVNSAGDPDLARRYLEESLTIFQENGDQLGVGRAYWGMCDLAFLGGDLAGCIALARKAESIFERLDAPFDLGWSRFMIGHASYISGDPVTAREAFDTALPLFIDAGDISAFVLVVYSKAGILEVEGNPVTAARLLGALEVLVKQSGAGIGEVEANRYGSLVRLRESTDPKIQEALSGGRRLSTEEVVELAIST